MHHLFSASAREEFWILKTVAWQVCVLLSRWWYISACQISSRPFSLSSLALCLATVSVHADILYLQCNTKIDLLGAPLLLHISHLPIAALVSGAQHCLSSSIIRNLNPFWVFRIFKWLCDWYQCPSLYSTLFHAILY